MNVSAVWHPGASATNYRIAAPISALQRLGHRPMPVAAEPGAADPELLRQCDVVLVHARTDPKTREIIAAVAAEGVGIVYDNDDDYTLVPDDHPHRRELEGAFERTVDMARVAHVMTTTTEPIAARYREHGIERIEIVPNYLAFGAVAPPREHDGLVVGWVAGLEHRQDAVSLELAETMERLLSKHRDLRVECLGVDLGLSQRYDHAAFVPFQDLPERIAGWDVGLAPLADLPMNWVRSDIKVKEYAARGVPWVASPIGPYRELGPEQGGVLAEDADWYAVVHRLLRKRRERRRLSEAGIASARRQTIARAARRYETILEEATRLARA